VLRTQSFGLTGLPANGVSTIVELKELPQDDEEFGESRRSA
jgi:hypothetical protein